MHRRCPRPPRQIHHYVQGVYPRVCGEADVADAAVECDFGLSPRVRGSPSHPSIQRLYPGSIPACAGKPWGCTESRSTQRVYPRVCGEARPPQHRHALRRGLSPRVRGSRASRRMSACQSRSIPACAGKPDVPVALVSQGRVYPRVCGEARRRQGQNFPREGLSPRVRGSPGSRIIETRGVGSIPACAGKPSRAAAPGRAVRVYPRVCGEAQPPMDPNHRRKGLSPRVRGSRTVHENAPAGHGSIPACAGKPATGVGRIYIDGVYPRVCGEAQGSRAGERGGVGLSPRVRGSPPRARLRAGGRGSIPACAGKPPRRRRGRKLLKVYPRVCGEAWSGPQNWRWRAGLSPRVRGSRAGPAPALVGSGSIPACAGKPGGPPPRRRRARVYPRVCGEAEGQYAPEFIIYGLSPRVRGSPLGPIGIAIASGSIPACAGKPRGIVQRSPRRRVYPRVCGEASAAVRIQQHLEGLSPRVRGSRCSNRQRSVCAGSIPACAGKPAPAPAPRQRRRVYPRVCGEAVLQLYHRLYLQGLSPRVRGSQPLVGGRLAVRGSIPACAGKPGGRGPPTGPRRVYPRVCGEAGITSSAPSPNAGLSPRVRGSPAVQPHGQRIRGSIPACAGKPKTAASYPQP